MIEVYNVSFVKLLAYGFTSHFCFTVALIFEPNSSVVRRGVEGFVDVASLVHTVYMIISHDWIRSNGIGNRGNLAIIVHCVQESDRLSGIIDSF